MVKGESARPEYDRMLEDLGAPMSRLIGRSGNLSSSDLARVEEAIRRLAP